MPITLQASATQWAFMEAEADVVGLEGSRGEGKTTAGYMRLLHKASQLPGHVRPLRVACIRDTLVNLRSTTIQTLKELQALGLAVEWKHTDGVESEATLGRGLVHLHFYGLDRMAEISKFQGLGLGVLWLEEPAPAADISGGIPAEVFGVGITSLRQAGVLRPWVQFTMNPPDHDHWTVVLQANLRAVATERGTPFTVEWFRIPPGENRHITDAQREKWRIGLEATGRADLVARLIEGRRGQVILGEPVIPEYADDLHTAARPLPILRSVPIIRCWDFGLSPTVVWTQVTPLGFWHWLWAVQATNAGAQQLIDQWIKPWESDYLKGHDGGMRDLGDAAGRQREQANSTMSAAGVIEQELGTGFEPGPIYWPERRDALKAVCSRLIRGRPVVQVDPDNLLVRRALRGGWHYRRDGLGRITPTIESAKKASGLHDHVGHALAHGASILFPVSGGSHDRYRRALPPRVERAGPMAWMEA